MTLLSRTSAVVLIAATALVS
ncbi:MAG: hypothetical protein K0S96_402, partial [Geminicoccaceae bacterium]|nr:hypothetical protein [Geminicoccaceae bacterium]